MGQCDFIQGKTINLKVLLIPCRAAFHGVSRAGPYTGGDNADKVRGPEALGGFQEGFRGGPEKGPQGPKKGKKKKEKQKENKKEKKEENKKDSDTGIYASDEWIC